MLVVAGCEEDMLPAGVWLSPCSRKAALQSRNPEPGHWHYVLLECFLNLEGGACESTFAGA